MILIESEILSKRARDKMGQIERDYGDTRGRRYAEDALLEPRWGYLELPNNPAYPTPFKEILGFQEVELFLGPDGSPIDPFEPEKFLGLLCTLRHITEDLRIGDALPRFGCIADLFQVMRDVNSTPRPTRLNYPFRSNGESVKLEANRHKGVFRQFKELFDFGLLAVELKFLGETPRLLISKS
jgi:hypothetical protein